MVTEHVHQSPSPVGTPELTAHYMAESCTMWLVRTFEVWVSGAVALSVLPMHLYSPNVGDSGRKMQFQAYPGKQGIPVSKKKPSLANFAVMFISKFLFKF